ncbi:MAG: hypothetical protein JSS62_04870 [Verrucomicrobia bacterium]|nr:hypothetical protein [Verrucomicrobiota bacterium]MBS0646749.1 hypothetical protein [Verrucomicrobiota bacterium]
MNALFALIVFIVEGLGVSAYFLGYCPLAVVLILHFCILCLLYKHTMRCKFLNESYLLLLAVFGGGPLGAAGFLMFCLLLPLFRKFMTPMQKWLAELFPEHSTSDFLNIFQRVRSRWDAYENITEVVSFRDLFVSGTVLQKQAVLDMIVKDFKPSFSSVLKLALKDEHNSVRIQAAAIVTKIETDFEKACAELVEKYESQERTPQLALKLAKYYDVYVSLDFFSSDRQKKITEQALHFYHLYLQAFSQDAEIWFAVGHLLFQTKNYIGYIKWCENYQKAFKNFPTLAYSWYLEALYALQRYQDMAITHSERI